MPDEPELTYIPSKPWFLPWLKSLLVPHKPPYPMLEEGVEWKLAEIEFRIARLELRPGDILVVKSRQRLSKIQVDRLADYLKPILEGRRCLVLDSGLDLAVLTAAEIEARSS